MKRMKDDLLWREAGEGRRSEGREDRKRAKATGTF